MKLFTGIKRQNIEAAMKEQKQVLSISDLLQIKGGSDGESGIIIDK